VWNVRTAPQFWHLRFSGTSRTRECRCNATLVVMSDVPAPGDTDQLEPLCALCNAEVPAMAAIIYHGVVYHPACVAPTLGPIPRPTLAERPSRPERSR
jgi:hypothetical protein